MDKGKASWSVGELAVAAGVTVRTLHHYDRLGLLAPLERSDAGYRNYDRNGVDRLYRILALRGLGFALSMPEVPAEHAEWLRRVQNELFDLGAELSAPGVALGDGGGVEAGEVAWLDESCERLNAGLEPLDSFLLPGGGPPYPAQLQVCRAVCRRAERRLVATGEAGPAALAYLNRLSDFLFILARSVTATETVWEPRPRQRRI